MRPTRAPTPWMATLFAVALFALGAPRAGADEPRPRVSTLHSPRPRSGDALRKAPKSLSYIYGDGSKSGTESGGDAGTNPGGDGTGDAQAKIPADPGGVTGHDRGQQSLEIHPSTFNTANLDGLAACFCVDAPRSGWATAPGYGNGWDQRYLWSRSVADFGLPTSVRFRFPFNYDTERGRDFFLVEVNRGGFFEELARYSGTNKSVQGFFDLPEIFDQTFVMQPGDYVGPNRDEVELRLRVVTDREGSDEDGLYPSDGAVQADDLQIWFDGEQVGLAPFDVPPFDDGWQGEVRPFAGDFTKLLPMLTDIDPCRENVTNQFTFIDDGTPPRNAPGQSTGGSVSSNWDYGPGGYVVNFTGGISGGEAALDNEWRTPAFAWDPPGPSDDGKYGALLGFGIWKHLPYRNGIFYDWQIRTRSVQTGQWGPWRDRGMSYYDPSAPHYERVEIDVSDLVEENPDSIQVALGVVDLADRLGLPGDDATPAPMFDNIWFAKYPRQGPAIAVEDADRFQDAFPQSGSANYNGPMGALSVRLDAARDIAPPGAANTPGDSLVARVKSIVPGVGLEGVPVLRWVLRPNPVFANARSYPVGTTFPTVAAGKCESPGPLTAATGTVIGQAVQTATGAVIADEYFFDLPDGPALAPHQVNELAMFFPGDEIHYFLEASDVTGVVSTLPPDTTGFFDFRECSAYDRDFRVRALPSLRPVGAPAQLVGAEFLVIDDGGDPERQGTLEHALLEAGLRPGEDYDLYAVNSPASGESNGIGSSKAHGANAAQLADYRFVIYDCGEMGEFLLSDGSDDPLNDKGDDLGVLSTWHNLSGDRGAAHFGDNLVSGLWGQSASGIAYVTNVMAARWIDRDVRDDISGQLAPFVRPISGATPVFATEFVIGGCLASDEFDAIEARPIATAHRSHEFLDPQGQPGIYPVAAGVWHERSNGSGLARDATFPFSLSAILNPVQKSAAAKGLARRSVRSVFLEELVKNLGGGTGVPTGGAPTLARAHLAPNVPNPFNPRTEIQFYLPQGARVRLNVYDLGGRRVRRLLDETRPAGAQSVVWNAEDDRGREVSSGVYLVQMRSGDVVEQRKVAVVR